MTSDGWREARCTGSTKSNRRRNAPALSLLFILAGVGLLSLRRNQGRMKVGKAMKEVV